MSYFKSCRTAEELKKEYRKCAIKLHPDVTGGSDEEFKKMKAEYEERWEQLKNIHVNAEGETYTKETTETAAEFMDIINKIINISGIYIELCGSWVWITGDTKPHKDIFKNLGFHFSSKKSAWYYHREPFKKKSKSSLSMDEIRNMYGSSSFKTSGPELLPE